MKHFLYSMVLIIAAFLAPIKGLLILLVMFILLDTIFAIYASVKLKGWKSFTSSKLFNIVTKSFFYLLTVIMAFMADEYICGGSLFGIGHVLSKTMGIFWIGIEIKSLDETSMKLKNKSFWVLMRQMIGRYKNIKKDINDAE